MCYCATVTKCFFSIVRCKLCHWICHTGNSSKILPSRLPIARWPCFQMLKISGLVIEVIPKSVSLGCSWKTSRNPWNVITTLFKVFFMFIFFSPNVNVTVCTDKRNQLLQYSHLGLCITVLCAVFPYLRVIVGH